MQYLVMMGMFFAMPLFLTLCLGLDAFDTGVRMLPLSLALVVTAPRSRSCCRRVAPPRVQAGLLLMLAAALLLAARLEDGADASITTLPFLLMGAGMGAMASQLGNVVVSVRARRERQRGRRPPVHGPEPRLVARAPRWSARSSSAPRHAAPSRGSSRRPR